MRFEKRNDLTAEFVRSILEYDGKTGLFRWKFNPQRKKEWNTRRAGKAAGGKSGDVHTIRIDDRLYLSHRIAWLITYGEWPADEIDHINGDPMDNRVENLREATHAENSCNRSFQCNNTNGFIGVRFRPHHGKWEGRINFNGKTVWRKYFDTAQEAAAARRIAVEEIHGDFTPRHPKRRSAYKKPHDAPPDL